MPREALHHCDVHAAGRLALASADDPDPGRVEIEELCQPLGPLLEQWTCDARARVRTAPSSDHACRDHRLPIPGAPQSTPSSWASMS